jgi:hypothetical protein
MKSVSFIMGLFVFFTSIILSMIWIIVFQFHSDQFMIHSKQLHRTLSMSCLDYSCNASQLLTRIDNETRKRWPHQSSLKRSITTLLFDPLVLEIEIELTIPIGLDDITLKYSKIMIEERK